MRGLELWQKRALLQLNSHVDAVLGGFEQISRRMGAQSNYIRIRTADPMEFVTADMYGEVAGLTDDERATIGRTTRRARLSEARDMLEDYGLDIHEIESMINE